MDILRNVPAGLELLMIELENMSSEDLIDPPQEVFDDDHVVGEMGPGLQRFYSHIQTLRNNGARLEYESKISRRRDEAERLSLEAIRSL